MESNVIKYQGKGGQEITLSFDLIKRYLVSGRAELVTPQEMMLFMGICKERQLNPFARDCYLIKYTADDPAAIVTSIDYFRSRAKAQPDCRGWSKGIIVRTAKGEIKKTAGLLLEGETLLGGWFRAQPEGWGEPQELEVNLRGYVKRTRDGRLTRFWSEDNQPSQIMKVAESQGLRTIWPDVFGKVYLEGGEIEVESSPASTVLETLQSKADAEAAFWEKVGSRLGDYGERLSGLWKASVLRFVDEIANAHSAMGMTRKEVMSEAIDRFDEFWEKFSARSKKVDHPEAQNKEEKVEKSPPEKETESEKPDDDENRTSAPPEKKSTDEEITNEPSLVEKWHARLEESELTDAWKGYITFVEWKEQEQVIKAVESIDEIGFDKVLRRLGQWWILIPQKDRDRLAKNQKIDDLAKIHRERGEKILK